MANVSGIDEVSRMMDRARRKYAQPDGEVSVVVGCTQRYALFVHEDMEANHPVGQAKFLETPARRLGKELGQAVTNAVQNGATLTQGMILAGLRLQREAQMLTPVDTSALKASFFTVVEEELEPKSQEMFERSEKVRRSSSGRKKTTGR